MTEDEALDMISLAIPATLADRTKIAKGFLRSAMSDVALLEQFDFNRQKVTITLTSGQRRYVIGEDILTDEADVYGFTDLYFTSADPYTAKVEVMGQEGFQVRFSTQATTGKPEYACSYRAPQQSGLTLEVYPIPDSNYEIFTFAKRGLARWDDIPIHAKGVIANAASRKAADVGARLQGASIPNTDQQATLASSQVFHGEQLKYESQFQGSGRFSNRRGRAWRNNLTGS